jgi:phage anti-repressor protein/phage antirepressor YoqD-like protein
MARLMPARVSPSLFHPTTDLSAVSFLRFTVESIRPYRGGGVVAPVTSDNIGFSVAIPDGLSVQPGDRLVAEPPKGVNPLIGPYTAIYPASKKPELPAAPTSRKENSTMNELIALTAQPINGQTIPTVNARELHAKLEVKKDFSDWIKQQLEIFTQGIDFAIFPPKRGEGTNRIEYALTLRCAEHIAMMSRTEKGRELRDYFIDCKRRIREQPALDLANPAHLRSALLTYTEKVIALEAKVEEQAPKVAALKRIEAGEKDLTFTQAAKVLGVKREPLIKRLHAEGWIYPQNGSWLAHSAAIRTGRLVYKEAHFTNEKTGL